MEELKRNLKQFFGNSSVGKKSKFGKIQFWDKNSIFLFFFCFFRKHFKVPKIRKINKF